MSVSFACLGAFATLTRTEPTQHAEQTLVSLSCREFIVYCDQEYTLKTS